MTVDSVTGCVGVVLVSGSLSSVSKEIVVASASLGLYDASVVESSIVLTIRVATDVRRGAFVDAGVELTGSGTRISGTPGSPRVSSGWKNVGTMSEAFVDVGGEVIRPGKSVVGIEVDSKYWNIS